MSLKRQFRCLSANLYNASISLWAHWIVAFHGGVQGNPVLSRGAHARLNYDSRMHPHPRLVAMPPFKVYKYPSPVGSGFVFRILDLGFESNLAAPLLSS